MLRREFILLSSLMPLFAFSDTSISNQVKQGQEDMIKPYLAVGPYPDDRNRVFMFISYSCAYCAETLPGMVAWGNTLPKPFQFVVVPLFLDHIQTAAATAFYVVRDIAPSRLYEYSQIAFNQQNATGVDDFVVILRKMGISHKKVSDSLKKDITKQRINRAMMLASKYRVTHTPFFSIGGFYTTHAGFTNGDYRLLTQLLNALVSDVIQNKN